jgi:hypothetical protein
MPLKKKQIVRSNVTLHDFFNPGATSSEKTQIARSKFEGRRASKIEATPQDIIVVDSDSDDELIVSQIQRTQGKKRRRLSGSSDEVEFVEQGRVHKIMSQGRRESNMNSSAQETTVPSFGSPFLLFPVAPSSSTSLSLGSPKLLSNITEQRSEPELYRPPPCPPPPSDAQNSALYDGDTSGMDFDFSANTLDDEWGTGDDEIVSEPLADDEGNDVYDSLISLAPDVSCPYSAFASASGGAGRSTVSQAVSDFVRMLFYKTHNSLGRETRPGIVDCGGNFKTDPIFVFSFISSGPWTFAVDKLRRKNQA